MPQIPAQPITQEEFDAVLAEHPRLLKVAVDIRREALCYDCEMHVDCYNKLIEAGSDPKDIWGAGVYPKDRSIDYSSMVNRRLPSNRSMEVEDPAARNRIAEIIKKFFPI